MRELNFLDKVLIKKKKRNYTFNIHSQRLQYIKKYTA